MKTETQQQSEPPAVAGGLTQQPTTTAATAAHVSSPSVSEGPEPVNGGHESLPNGRATDTDDLAALRAENEQLKATIRNDAAHRQITGELAASGARSPELLFDAVKGELQFGDDGAVQNAAELVDKLKSAFPDQFGVSAPQSIDAGSGQTSAPRLTRDVLARLKPSEIAELDWNDVKRVLAG